MAYGDRDVSLVSELSGFVGLCVFEFGWRQSALVSSVTDLKRATPPLTPASTAS